MPLHNECIKSICNYRGSVFQFFLTYSVSVMHPQTQILCVSEKNSILHGTTYGILLSARKDDLQVALSAMDGPDNISSIYVARSDPLGRIQRDAPGLEETSTKTAIDFVFSHRSIQMGAFAFEKTLLIESKDSLANTIDVLFERSKWSSG
ncbi:unnamed protein product [Albugo candida]|uniref:Uncharacterized protein n=1 Tax=Albugo candida TaxID=65357 RepID=A0A024GTX8_9STRA|nr:unnamed protein product [Albugo candida]|eukprot:CCI50260.1 unnamed protein product [Albugo candida]